MNTVTAQITLYDILIEQGVDKERARKAVDAFITRAEAEKGLATKEDLHVLEAGLRGEIKDLRAEMYRAFLVHGLIVVGAVLAAAKML